MALPAVRQVTDTWSVYVWPTLLLLPALFDVWQAEDV